MSPKSLVPVLVFALCACCVSCGPGLLRVPKVYNTVITSDANLEPSRAYPLLQPVLTVAVPIYQPWLYPAPFYYPSASAPLVGGGVRAPASVTATSVPPPPAQASPTDPTPAPARPDPLNNSHRHKNPGIPDVPPPPLPVKSARNA